MEHKNYISDTILVVETIGYAAMAGIGELMQNAVHSGIMNYNWGVGHISDIGASGLVTAMSLIKNDKLKNEIAITLAVPTIYSAFEIVPLFLKGLATKYDPQDLACYYGAAIVTFGIKKISDRIYKKKSQLENIIDNPEPNYY